MRKLLRRVADTLTTVKFVFTSPIFGKHSEKTCRASSWAAVIVNTLKVKWYQHN